MIFLSGIASVTLTLAGHLLPMNERLLQYIWQYRYFSQQGLFLESGEPVQVLFPGMFNNNQGPDFLDARVRIGQTTWAGDVEIHIRASDWTRHTHATDENYDSVILHVVMENDDQQQDREIPILVLGQRIPRLLLDKCEEWMGSRAFIPCEKTIRQADGMLWSAWNRKLLEERLIRRAEDIRQSLEGNHSHWEEVFWWQLAANFGIRVNTKSFEALARSIPITLLARHKPRISQLEALLFGQAGLLARTYEDEYPCQLAQEFQFLQQKYRLKPIFEPIHFLRMRPRNFPTIRLSQLAALIHRSSHLFASIRDCIRLEEVKGLLSVQASEYWNRHYRFDESSAFCTKALGEQMVDNIAINTIVPMLFGYGWIYQEESIRARALDWLSQLAPESNSIISGWTRLGIRPGTAAHSQALLELKSFYCDEKRCLGCAIGHSLLGKFL